MFSETTVPRDTG